MSIAITGSTGKYGSRVLHTLSTLLAPSSIIAITRDISSAKALALPPGLILRQADFADPAALTTAFTGAKIALIVSVDKIGPEALQLHKAAIDAAVRGGVEKVYYTSHQNASPASEFAPSKDHYETEQYLSRAGVKFTSLRNGFYQGSLGHMLGGVRESGEVAKPEDGKVGWTDNDELADAAAMLLAKDLDGSPVGEYVTLANREAVDMSDVAGFIEWALGKPVERKVMGDEEFVAATIQRGVPAFMAEMFLGMFREARKGGFVSDDGTLEEVLGRKPRGVEAFLREKYGVEGK